MSLLDCKHGYPLGGRDCPECDDPAIEGLRRPYPGEVVDCFGMPCDLIEDDGVFVDPDGNVVVFRQDDTKGVASDDDLATRRNGDGRIPWCDV